MAITTEKLIEVYNELLPTAFKEGSLLVRAGTSNISWNTTDITTVTIGAPSNVDEGGIKPIKDPKIDNFKVMELKLAGILPITDEAEDTAEGEAIITRAVAEFISNFPAAVDISILAGTDPATGTAVARYADVNLKDNAVKFTSASAETVDETLKEARYSVKGRGSKIVMSDEGHAQMSSLDGPNGYQKHPQLDLANPTFRGLEVLYGDAAGQNGFTASEVFLNKVLQYVGPFQNISIAFQPITVKISDTASAGGYNAFENNYSLYRVEQRVRFYIHEPEKFAVVLDGTV